MYGVLGFCFCLEGLDNFSDFWNGLATGDFDFWNGLATGVAVRGMICEDLYVFAALARNTGDEDFCIL